MSRRRDGWLGAGRGPLGRHRRVHRRDSHPQQRNRGSWPVRLPGALTSGSLAPAASRSMLHGHCQLAARVSFATQATALRARTAPSLSRTHCPTRRRQQCRHRWSKFIASRGGGREGVQCGLNAIAVICRYSKCDYIGPVFVVLIRGLRRSNFRSKRASRSYYGKRWQRHWCASLEPDNSGSFQVDCTAFHDRGIAWQPRPFLDEKPDAERAIHGVDQAVSETASQSGAHPRPGTRRK